VTGRPFDNSFCPIARVTDLIGDSWTPILLRDLVYGVSRFDELQERNEISRATLTVRLERLVTEGVLEKVMYQERPARYEYKPTEKGLDLWNVLAAMWRWGEDWMFDGEPPVQLTDRSTGLQVRPLVVDENTGKPLDLQQLRVRFRKRRSAAAE
jgi:DNA-binding HxlR family transcriptional regulator